MQNNTGFPNITNGNILENISGMSEIQHQSIFNKTCNEITNRLIGETNLSKTNITLGEILPNNQSVLGIQVPVQQLIQNAGNQLNSGNQSNITMGETIEKITHIPTIEKITQIPTINNSTKKTYYSILGYEFSLWVLILILLIIITIIYFIYKWYFSYDSQIVTITKSKQNVKLINLPNNKKLNQEITDSENSESKSSSSSSSNSGSSSSSKSSSKSNSKKLSK